MIGVQSHMKTLVAAVRSPETAAEIEAYCAAATDIVSEIKLVDTSIADAPSVINGGADIVVIEAGRAGGADIEALERLCAYVTRGGSFIVIMEEPSADVVRRLFRAGVTDVLPTPVAPMELVAALNAARDREFARRAAAPVAAKGRIVTVVKTAGGVGATTIAANLAGAFARLQAGRVALVDLDIQFGQAATTLDLRPRMNVLDAVRAGARLDPTLLASTMQAHSSGVLVLGAPSEITPLEAINEQFIERLFATLRAVAAVSVIEIPAAWSQWIGDVLDRSDLAVVVAEPTVRSAAGAARIAQSFVDFGLTKLGVYVLVNKYEKTIENNERAKRIAEIFRTKPGGAVRLDAKAAAEAGDRGLLFADAAARTQATKDFETNARNIAATLGIEIAEETAPAPPLERILAGRLGLNRGRNP
ncbi:MAG: AAA family ATPase [Parvularculaceae bacterium]|nr:AAA family ATPase [Parvularculaceae bacterium]